MKPCFFFNGTDPALSERQTSDDGASVVGVATPRRELAPGEPLPRSEIDWNFDFVYARVFNSKHRLSARQWSGYLHGLHERFGFEQMVLDAGSGGGGGYMKREMMLPNQLINGVERVVVPISDKTVESQRVVAHARFILNMFKRGDPGIDSVWPDPTGSKSLAGDDLLKDALLCSVREALFHGVLHGSARADEYMATHQSEVQTWGEERKWALINLTTGWEQMTKIVVETTEKDGQQVELHTARGSRRFSTLGKDDIAYAMMYCYAAFRVWLQAADEWESHGEGGGALFAFG